MTRRRFTEKDVIRTLLHQGVEIRDYRTREPITLQNVDRIEREHLHEVALGGPDEPANCRYSLGENHGIVTNGSPSTTAGSSKNRIAKTHPTRAEKFQVRKQALDADLVGELPPKCRGCGEVREDCTCAPAAPRQSAFARARR